MRASLDRVVRIPFAHERLLDRSVFDQSHNGLWMGVLFRTQEMKRALK